MDTGVTKETIRQIAALCNLQLDHDLEDMENCRSIILQGLLQGDPC